MSGCSCSLMGIVSFFTSWMLRLSRALNQSFQVVVQRLYQGKRATRRQRLVARVGGLVQVFGQIAPVAGKAGIQDRCNAGSVGQNNLARQSAAIAEKAQQPPA